MPARALPNLGLLGFWDLGFDGWKDDNDLNLLALSVLVQGTAIDFVSATPGPPTDGDVYVFLDDHPTQPNDIAVYDVATWKYFTPNDGWMMYDRAADKLMRFNAGVWAEVASGGGGISEAPIDGTGYVRKDGDWEAESGGGGGGAPPSSWSHGWGDRTNSIGISQTGGSGNIRACLWIMPVTTFFWTNGGPTKEVIFDFLTANILQGFMVRQDGNGANGTWTIAGSNDNFATHTDIITDYQWGGTPYCSLGTTDGFVYMREFANATAYRYYRMSLNVGSATSNGPYVQHFGFKCQPI